MKKHILMVLSNPVAGREEEYNRWYSERHIDDVLKVPGFLAAKRYRLASDDFFKGWRYLAIYQFETDDIQSTIDELVSRAGSETMVLSNAMNMDDYQMTPWAELD